MDYEKNVGIILVSKFQLPRFSSASPLLSSLHWLPIDKRIHFKILLHIHKTLSDLSPVYLSQSIQVYVPPTQHLRFLCITNIYSHVRYS